MCDGVLNGSFGSRNGGAPAGIAVVAAEAVCGAGRVAGTRACAVVCLAESSQPVHARETAAATAMQNRSRFAYRYVKSGGPQTDYGKERGGGWSTGSRYRVGGLGTGDWAGNWKRENGNWGGESHAAAFLPTSIFYFPISNSGPVGEQRIDGGVDPVFVEGVVAVFQIGTVSGGEVPAPVRASAVGVREGIFVGEAPGAEDAAGFFGEIFVASFSIII